MSNIYKLSINGGSVITDQDIQILHIGLTLGSVFSSRTFGISSNDKIKNNIIKNLNDSEFTNKTLYKLDGCLLQKDKMNIFKDKHNIKMTKDPNTADYIVVSTKALNKLSKCLSHSVYKKNEIVKWVDSCPEFTNSALALLTDFFKTINNEDEISVSIGWCECRSSLIRALRKNMCINYSIYMPNQNMALYNLLLNNNNLLSTDAIIDSLNKNGLILTEDHYFKLTKMIQSTDPDNINLALEIMANSNYCESFDILAMLIIFNDMKLSSSSNWNTANVKMLRSYMDSICPLKLSHIKFNPGVSGGPIVQLTQLLIKAKRLTRFSVKIMSFMLLEEVLKPVINGGSNNPDIFKIDTDAIKLNPLYEVNYNESNNQ